MLVLLSVLSTSPSAPLKWRDSLRDIYIDGGLEGNGLMVGTSSAGALDGYRACVACRLACPDGSGDPASARGINSGL